MFFEGNNFVLSFFGQKRFQNWPKMKFYRYYQKSSVWSASHSCTKLLQHAELKLRQLIFVGHDFALKFLDQNGPQMKFLKFCGNSMLETFLIFWINLQHQGLKLTHDFFRDNSCFVVFWQKVVQKWSFKFYEEWNPGIFLTIWKHFFSFLEKTCFDHLN